MDIRAFVKDVLDHMLDQCDEDLQDFALEHGLLKENGVIYTDELKAWLAEEQ